MSPAAFLNFLGEGVAVLINLLDGHRAKDGAQMAFECLRGDVADFIGAFPQKLLGRRADGNIVAFDLGLRHAIHLHRHAFARIDLRRLHINGQQFQ